MAINRNFMTLMDIICLRHEHQPQSHRAKKQYMQIEEKGILRCCWYINRLYCFYVNNLNALNITKSAHWIRLVLRLFIYCISKTFMFLAVISLTFSVFSGWFMKFIVFVSGCFQACSSVHLVQTKGKKLYIVAF